MQKFVHWLILADKLGFDSDRSRRRKRRRQAAI
jgi:hypothetical protein